MKKDSGALSLSEIDARQVLAEAFENIAESQVEKDIVRRYREEINNIDARIDDRRAPSHEIPTKLHQISNYSKNFKNISKHFPKPLDFQRL